MHKATERSDILERLQLAVALAHVDEVADHLNKVAKSSGGEMRTPMNSMNS